MNSEGFRNPWSGRLPRTYGGPSPEETSPELKQLSGELERLERRVVENLRRDDADVWEAHFAGAQSRGRGSRRAEDMEAAVNRWREGWALWMDRAWRRGRLVSMLLEVQVVLMRLSGYRFPRFWQAMASNLVLGLQSPDEPVEAEGVADHRETQLVLSIAQPEWTLRDRRPGGLSGSGSSSWYR